MLFKLTTERQISGCLDTESSTPSFKKVLLRNIFWLLPLAVLMLLPVWCVKQPPLRDYPNHLARAFVLAHLHDPAYQFGDYFKAVWGPYPYVVMDLILMAMQKFMPLAIAGKLLLSISILLLPISLWWFLRNVAPNQQAFALFGCVLSYQSFCIEGFINFQLGLALGCIIMGSWHGYRESPSASRWIRLLGLTFLLYFTHLIAFGLVAMAIGASALLARSRRWELIRLTVLFLPGTALFLYVRPGLSPDPARKAGIILRPFIEKLFSLGPVALGGYARCANIACYVLFLLAVAVALIGNPELRWNRRLLTTWLWLLGVYWLLPATWGTTYDIDLRIVPLLCILLVAVADIGRRVRWVTAILVLIVAVRLVDMTAAFERESARLRGWNASFAYIPTGARVLPIIENNGDADEPAHFSYSHYACYAVIERGAFVPYLFAVPGQMALRMTYKGYILEGYWLMDYKTAISWPDVATAYDYIWAYDVTRFDSDIEKIAIPVYRSDKLVLYRVHEEDGQQKITTKSTNDRDISLTQ